MVFLLSAFWWLWDVDHAIEIYSAIELERESADLGWTTIKVTKLWHSQNQRGMSACHGCSWQLSTHELHEPCQNTLGLVHGNWWLNIMELYNKIFVVWNCLWWRYLYWRSWQAPWGSFRLLRDTVYHISTSFLPVPMKHTSCSSDNNKTDWDCLGHRCQLDLPELDNHQSPPVCLSGPLFCCLGSSPFS